MVPQSALSNTSLCSCYLSLSPRLLSLPYVILFINCYCPPSIFCQQYRRDPPLNMPMHDACCFLPCFRNLQCQCNS